MPKLKISREYSFSYGHRLVAKELSEAENKVLFGKCYNWPGHGHNSIVIVTVSGALTQGMIINFHALDDIVKPLLEIWDHQFLNDLKDFNNMIPTCENMSTILFHKIELVFMKQCPHVAIESVAISETPKSWAIYGVE